MEPRTPDNIGHVKDTAVLQHGQPVAHADCPGDAFDPERSNVVRLNPDQWPATRNDLRACLAADWRLHRQDPVEESTSAYFVTMGR